MAILAISSHLAAEAGGLAAVQQGVDDELAVPLDGVVQPVPRAVILDCGVTTSGDQSTSNVLITAQNRYVT